MWAELMIIPFCSFDAIISLHPSLSSATLLNLCLCKKSAMTGKFAILLMQFPECIHKYVAIQLVNSEVCVRLSWHRLHQHCDVVVVRGFDCQMLCRGYSKHLNLAAVVAHKV